MPGWTLLPVSIWLHRGSIRERLAELFPLTKEASEGIRVAGLELGVRQVCLLMVLCVREYVEKRGCPLWRGGRCRGQQQQNLAEGMCMCVSRSVAAGQ